MLRRARHGHRGRPECGDLQLQPLVELRPYGPELDAGLRQRGSPAGLEPGAADAGSGRPLALDAPGADAEADSDAEADANSHAVQLGVAIAQPDAVRPTVAVAITDLLAGAGAESVGQPEPECHAVTYTVGERVTVTQPVTQRVTVAKPEPVAALLGPDRPARVNGCWTPPTG